MPVRPEAQQARNSHRQIQATDASVAQKFDDIIRLLDSPPPDLRTAIERANQEVER
jgi:hypothetical protein